jgi:hypothetical protein
VHLLVGIFKVDVGRLDVVEEHTGQLDQSLSET